MIELEPVKELTHNLAQDPDPILFSAPLPLHRTFYPLGFPLELVTNSARILECAHASWHKFPQRFYEEPLRLHIGMADGPPGPCPFPPVCRRQRHLLTNIADAHNFMVSDLSQGFAFGWVTESLVRSSAYLRYHFLEGTALGILASLHLIPIHAACVSRNGRGILLCGDSGAGKSSLAYACARAGLDFTSDDSSYLVRCRGDRSVIANAYQMRFRESAVRLFPELGSEPVTPRFSGKLAIEVPTERMPGVIIRPECHIEHIVFLNRGAATAPYLAPYSKTDAFPYFRRCLFGEEHALKPQIASLIGLLTAQVHQLHYSDLDSAVERLERLLADDDHIAVLGQPA